MLQKALAKRLKARYDTKMDGSGWLEVSSDGIPLCRIKYNGQFLSNADKNLSDEYRSKIADIQDEISMVREYVGLYEHAPQIKADGVSDYRQLAAKNIVKANYTLLSALYLLTADQRLWVCCKHHINNGCVFFENIKLNNCTERAYTLYCAAKDLTLGTKHLTVSDLSDADLVPPMLFRTICNAMAIRRFGLAAIKEI